MVLFVCPIYCFLHFLHVMQYIRLELLHVILVLLSYSTDVAVHIILPLVFKIGQNLHCFFAMHLFLIWFVVHIVVSDVLRVTCVALFLVTVVVEVLPCRASFSLGFFVRKSSMVLCFCGAFFLFPSGKVSSLALFFGCRNKTAFGGFFFTSALTIRSL